MCNIQKMKKFNFDLTKEGQEIYLQHYFLFVFKCVLEKKSSILDIPNSLSFLPKQKAAEIARKILVFNNEVQIRKFVNKVMKSKNKSSAKDLKDKIDTDKLLNFFIQEYYDKKVNLQNLILRNLTKINAKSNSILSTLDIQ